VVHSYQQNKSDTISTIVEAVNVEALQDALALRRNVFIQGYLSQVQNRTTQKQKTIKTKKK